MLFSMIKAGLKNLSIIDNIFLKLQYFKVSDTPMRAGTWLFGSTFTDAYLQFQKSQKANFSCICSTFGMLHIYHATNRNLALWGVYELSKLLLFYAKI